MDRVLGIDGGGSKTEVALVDSKGRVLRRLHFGGLDPTLDNRWEADLSVVAAEVGPVAQAVIGLPYHGEIPAVSARQSEVVAQLFGATSRVLNDVEVAFDGALAGGDGVLILAGTGSMAWARGPLGTYRVGGWGDLFGDEGSAFWIGREALGRVSRELDERRPGRGFADAILPRIGIKRDELISWAYGTDPHRPRIARLAAFVSALAQAGNADAVELMTDAAHQLADLGQTAARLSGASARWSFAGGVMADPTVRRILAERMGSAPTTPILPPVGGAVLRAAKAAEWDLSDGFMRQLCADLTTEPDDFPVRGRISEPLSQLKD